MVKVYWFTAAWCGPCKKMKPVMEKVSAEHHAAGLRVAITDVDTDEGKRLAAQYRVTGVPTFVRVDEAGNELARLVGAHPKGKVEKALGLS